jgi:hypothetical protein
VDFLLALGSVNFHPQFFSAFALSYTLASASLLAGETILLLADTHVSVAMNGVPPSMRHH